MNQEEDLDYTEMTLEKTSERDEFIISLLKEIKEKQDLQLKQNAWILSKLKIQDEKLDSLLDRTPRYRSQTDASVAKRERTWN
jgi:hypothetical protein